MQLIPYFFKGLFIFSLIFFLIAIHSNFAEMIVFLSMCLYLLFFLFSNKSFIPLLYCIFIFLFILFPWICLQLEIGLEIMSWYSSEVSLHTMIYINVFILLVISSFTLFKRLLNNDPWSIFSYQYKGFALDSKLIVILFFTISIFGDIGLYQLGLFKAVSQEFVSSPFASYIKIFSSFKYMALLYIGYLINNDRADSSLKFLYFWILIPYSIVIGISSGSRYLTLLPIIITAYSHFSFYLRYIPVAVGVTPFLFMLFPILGHYRSMENPTLIAALEKAMEDITILENILAVALNRFDMLGPIHNVIDQYKDNITYHSDYIYNFIGIVPRLFWPGKPSPIDTNDLGVQLMMIAPENYNTSISIDIIGESFYQLGYFGLCVAVFQGFILWLVDNKIGDKSAAGYILLFFIGLLTISSGTYVNIIPTILITILTSLPFLWLLNKKIV
jgi:hypothetical protein